jgi:hypothetical protein
MTLHAICKTVSIRFGRPLFLKSLAVPAIAVAIGALAAPAQAAAGWQVPQTFSISQGRTTQFIGYNCPADAPLVTAGAYDFAPSAQASGAELFFNGPRIDETPPFYGGWGFGFGWAAGAPAGTSVIVDIFCVKRA